MIAPRLQRQLTDPFRKTINRAPSPFLARAVPWLSVMLASLAPTMPLIASAPVLPPLGFMFLLSWRQLRPGLLPVWAGLPLGLFDDLYSGQPFGSAMLTWSLAMIVLDVIEARFPWRSFLFDWAEAAACRGLPPARPGFRQCRGRSNTGARAGAATGDFASALSAGRAHRFAV